MNPLQATTEDNRSKWFTRKYVLSMISLSLGPMASAVLFFYMGNNWNVKQCKL